MTEAEFRARRRQKYLTAKYFELNQKELAHSIARSVKYLPIRKAEGDLEPFGEGGIFKNHLKLLRLHYTAGEPIEALVPLYSEAIKWLRTWHEADVVHVRHLAKEFNKDLRLDMTPVEFDDLFHFQLALDVVSLGILLGQASLIGEAAQLMQSARHTDMLYETLLERLVPDPDTEITRFIHNQPYATLLKAVYEAETPEEESAFVKKYLEGWYKAFEGLPWHNGHSVVTDEYSNYEGYWAFEAAAICVLYDIDDSSFHDHIVYPKDLADWARKHKVLERLGPSGSGTDGTPTLRCESGQPCPQSGFWLSPAQLGSRRHFQAGELMPNLGGDYGVTIWQWDANQSA